MRRFSQRVVRAVAALVAIALGVVPEAAYAKCGDPFCFPHYRHVQPGHGEAIPQNAWGLEVAVDYGLTLEKSDGGAIYFQLRPGANGTQVLIPYEKIVGETYVAKSPYYSCP